MFYFFTFIATKNTISYSALAASEIKSHLSIQAIKYVWGIVPVPKNVLLAHVWQHRLSVNIFAIVLPLNCHVVMP